MLVWIDQSKSKIQACLKIKVNSTLLVAVGQQSVSRIPVYVKMILKNFDTGLLQLLSCRIHIYDWLQTSPASFAIV